MRRKKDRSKTADPETGSEQAGEGLDFDDLITRELDSPTVVDLDGEINLAMGQDLVEPARVDVTLDASDAENARLRAELLNPPPVSPGPSTASTVAAARASVLSRTASSTQASGAPDQTLPRLDSQLTQKALPEATPGDGIAASTHPPQQVRSAPEFNTHPGHELVGVAGAEQATLEPHDALIVPSEPVASMPGLETTDQASARSERWPVGRGSSGFSQLGFWDRYEEATAAAELFTVPPAAVTVVIGSLDVAMPVVEQCRSTHWVSDCDVFVLSEQEQVVGQPTWTMVRRPSEIVSVLENGESDFPLLVIDVPRELPAWIRPLIVRLRQGGVGLVHYVLGNDPSDEDLATWHGELGRPSVLDLASPVGPDRVLELLDRGEPISSVAGMPISTELLLALRLDRG